MSQRLLVAINRPVRCLAALVVGLGLLGVNPVPQPALASSIAGPAASAPAAPSLGLLPSPVPTLFVDTTSIADDPNDGHCDLWEAMQAVFQANNGLSPTYHECTALQNVPNVIGFSGAAAGGTILVPHNVGSGDLPVAHGDTTILGPVTIKPSATNTETHLLQTAPNATLTLIAVTLSDAHTSGGGAAIFDQFGATVNIIGSNIAGNVADNDGGAINSNGNVNVVLSNFSGNEARGSAGGLGQGGAINITGYGSLNVSKSNFAGNTAKGGGGAIYTSSQNGVVEDSLFTGNIGGQDQALNKGGGAIYNDVGGATAIARTQFAGNLAPQGNGGAIFNNSGGTMVITDTTFAANLAGDLSHAQLGGAVYNQASLAIQRSSFANNISVQGDGGGLAVDRHGTADVANTTFVANGAPNGSGGAVVITQTQQGGPASTFIARNVTIATNAASSGHGGGIYNGLGQNLTLGNALLSGNLTSNCAGAGNFDNSLGHNLDSGTSCNLPNSNGNISSGSANLGGPSFNGGPLASMLTMKLQRPSDAIDAGDNNICAGPQVNNEDQRSNKRPVDGTSPGNINPICDIGAYEADGPKPGYGSDPSEPGPIYVGSTMSGTTVATTLVVSNTGDFLLTITPHVLLGSNPTDFNVSQSVINIPVGSAPVNVVISCTPSATGPRSALLGFATTDVPLHAAVAYLLKCTGNAAAVAGFNSTPITPGPISFPDTVAFVQTSSRTIKVFETGDATLNVSGNPLGGANPGDFSVSGGSDNFSIADGGAPHNVIVQCTPQNYGIRSATLTLNTNDNTQTSVVYNLTCKGVPAPSPYLLGGTSMGNSPDHGLHHVIGVAISPDGNFAYATGNDGSDTDGRVASFNRDPVTGALHFITWVHDPFGGLNAPRLIALSPDGKNAYVAGQANGDLAELTVQPNGEMDYTHGYTLAALAGAFGVAVSPDGHNVYATGGSVSSVVVFTRTLATGDLNNTGYQVITSASNIGGAAGLVVSPDGQNVYVTGNSSNTLEVLKRNPANGMVTHLQTRKQGDTLDGPTALYGLAGANRVAVSPDGTSVYVASYGDSAVVEFSRSPANGVLTWIGTFQCGCGTLNGLSGAYGIDVTPDGLHVLANGYGAAAVVVFDRNPADGSLIFHEELSKANNGLPLGAAADLHISPDGRTAYVTAYTDDSIVVLPIANPIPLIKNISPASTPQGGPGFTMHIYGANFLPGSGVLGFSAQAVTYLNPYQLDVAVPSSSIINSGQVFIQVTNPEPVGPVQYSFPFYLQVIPPANHPIPAIDHIAPQGGLAGGSPLSLDVYGTNFLNGSMVMWNGAPRSTSFIDSGHLQASIQQFDVSQPGTSSVTVVTGGPGGGTSNQVPYTVAQPGDNAPPTLTGINPLWVFSYGAGSKQLQLTVTGQNFIQGSTVQIDGINRPTLFVDSAHLQATILGSDQFSPGTAGITVFTPGPGGGTSSALTFTIRKLFRLFVTLVRK